MKRWKVTISRRSAFNQ